MTSRRNSITEKARDVRSAAALRRPELTQPSDGFERVASTGAVSPMVKKPDPDTQRMIEDWQRKRTPRWPCR